MLLPGLLLSFSLERSALSLVPKQQVPSNQITTPKRRRFATIFNATARHTSLTAFRRAKGRPRRENEREKTRVLSTLGFAGGVKTSCHIVVEVKASYR